MSTDIEQNHEVVVDLAKYPNLKKIVDENPGVFEVSSGEIGFGRPCVGLHLVGLGHWVGYEIRSDDDNFESRARHDGAYGPNRPEDAYHKDEFFAVLIKDVADYEKGPTAEQIAAATVLLDKWFSDILAAGYKVQDYPESQNSIGALLGQATGAERRTLKAIIKA